MAVIADERVGEDDELAHDGSDSELWRFSGAYELVTRLGGSPRTSGSSLGAAHRAWTAISDAFSKGDEKATERVEEGEDYIEEKFREALERSDLNPQTREVLLRAHAQITEGERLTDRLEEQYD